MESTSIGRDWSAVEFDASPRRERWRECGGEILSPQGRDANVLIDTGYVSHASETLSLLRSLRHVGSEPLNWLVNNCHSDHMGVT